MDDFSKFCTCSPIIKIPTREDFLHPESHITPEEMLKYRAMQSRSTKPRTQPEEISEYSELDKTKYSHLRCAEASLAHYNNLHSTNYKLIETTKNNSFFHGWVWYHCVFKAALETSSVPEFFFAELHGLGSNKYHVVTVARVENVTESYDCQFCFGKNILHPVLTLSRDPALLYSEGRPQMLQHLREHEPPVHSGQFSEAAIRNSINAKVRMTDAVNTQICEDTEQTIATDAVPSHSPILPDNMQNQENIQARSSVKRKALEGVSPPR